jgi:hypothetical protein
MEAEDVAAFMMADDDEQPAVAPARPVPRAKAPKAPTKAPAKAPPKQPVPPQAKQAKRAPAPAPPPPRASPGPSAQDIRQLLMEEETVNMPSAPASSSGGGRFEPLSSEIEVEAVRRTTGGAGARGGGFLSVLVVGTEERSETMEETARTFVAYRIEAQKEGGGPYIIYRRYKQFEVLHSRCRQQGMKVGKLPERRPGNWFGLKVRRKRKCCFFKKQNTGCGSCCGC